MPGELPRTRPSGRVAWLAAGWALLVAAALALRPLLPIDETRYVSVAWEMWRRGDFLVPHLNGLPYSDKPPLLFWLFHLGWWAFGVNDVWPRLVPALCGLANLGLTGVLARRLWPDRPAVAAAAPAVLLGLLLWTVFTTLVMFDMLVATCVLLALLGIHSAWRRGGAAPWLLTGAALGLGILAKGPVALLVPLLTAALAPWWGRERGRRLFWWLGLAGSVGLAAAIGLLWALPAAAAGGPAYSDAILRSQTEERLVYSFAHNRPFWWYLALLPALLFPYSFWPPLWKAFARLRLRELDAGSRFCLAWLLPALAVFSAISGKQPHYLLPLMPGFALLAARALSSPGGGQEGGRRAWAPTPVALAVVVAAHAGFAVKMGAGYDLRPLARHLRAVEREERPIAYVGNYHGQLHFLGRLERPFEEIPLGSESLWIRRHPRGRVIQELRYLPPDVSRPGFTHPYRGEVLAVWGQEGIGPPLIQ